METKTKNYQHSDYQIYRIKDKPIDERPHEKLQKYGPEELSMQELLAAILYTGTRKLGVMEISARVINEYGDNYVIHETDPKKLAQFFDIPVQKATQIVACFALGKRLFENNKKRSITIRNARDAFKYLKPMGEYDKEYLRGLYLNSRFKLIHEETISIGTLSESMVHPREVFKPAIEHGAVAVILAHNHPSGSLEPSDADREITRHLQTAGEMMGIELLDHLVIAGDNFTSINIR